MRLTQLRVPMPPSTGLELYLLSNGNVVLATAYGFVPFADVGDGVTGMFDAEGFSLTAKGDDVAMKYEYNTAYPYKMLPVLKEWLIQQQLIWPVIVQQAA